MGKVVHFAGLTVAVLVIVALVARTDYATKFGLTKVV